MKNLLNMIIMATLLVASVASAMTTEQAAEKRLGDLTSAVSVTAEEKTTLAQLFLEREQKIAEIKQQNKGDRDAILAALKPINKNYNQQVKGIIGRERMKQYLSHLRANRQKR